MSVRLSASVSAAPPGRIYVKFDIGGFHENLSQKKKTNLLKVWKNIGRFA
jgi:alpha-glucosidase (family GH31 glycosyl hydrolase)